MDLRIVILNDKSDGERQIQDVITYLWNLKNKMNVCIKTETDLQMQRTNYWLPMGNMKRGGAK